MNKLFDPASFNLAGFKLEGPVILVIPLLLGIIAASVYSLMWIFRDAEQRRKNGFIAIIFILMTGWPLSLVWWLWLRPKAAFEPKAEPAGSANLASLGG